MIDTIPSIPTEKITTEVPENPGIKSGKTDEDHNMDNSSRDADLLEKMTCIMKETLKESLVEFRKELSKEISGITKSNDENIAKLKKEMNTKF